jgi:hypothetical protein
MMSMVFVAFQQNIQLHITINKDPARLDQNKKAGTQWRPLRWLRPAIRPTWEHN